MKCSLFEPEHVFWAPGQIKKLSSESGSQLQLQAFQHLSALTSSLKPCILFVNNIFINEETSLDLREFVRNVCPTSWPFI